MKLVIAIINSDDCHAVLSEITHAGFSATKLSTSGGFLRAGNVTLLIGVEEERLDTLIDIILKAHAVCDSFSFLCDGELCDCPR